MHSGASWLDPPVLSRIQLIRMLCDAVCVASLDVIHYMYCTTLYCRFLGDVSLVSTGFERAACAPEKVQTLVSSIHRVKQSQQRIVEAASSSMVAGVCTAYASIQSRISRFRLDAAFVERTEKIRDDMNRLVQSFTLSSIHRPAWRW